MTSRYLTLTTLVVAPTLVASTAAADEASPKPPPGLTLPAGKLNVAVNLEIAMTADQVAKPISISPDVSYGVTSDLTVALVHSRFATTGFRAGVGGGLCVTGTDGGCAEVYDNVGVEGWYSLARGALAVAAGGGAHAVKLHDGFYDLKAGAKIRYAVIDKVALHVQTNLLIAVTKREDAAGARLNKDSLWVPVVVTYKATPELTVGLGSGIKGPLSGFGDAWQVSLGALITYAIDPATGVGASWIFGQVLSGATNPPAPGPAVEGFDFRGLQIWGTLMF
ncbi:MAG: hypothetical protein IPL61_31580 [Myxococcales bacterium]|nr:hypothetical protein [Myxococcales bacterium]